MAFPEPFPLLTPDATDAPGTVDHHTSAVARLAEFIKNQPNFLAMLGTLTEQAQDLEVAFQELFTLRGLPNASGGQLDVIGQILKQPRSGLSDDVYRRYLKARMLLNLSSGTPDQILAIFDLLTDGSALRLKEFPPASFELEIVNPITSTQQVTFLQILTQARAAAVGADLHWKEWPDADTFTLDGTPAQSLDAGHLSGIAKS